MNDIQILLFVTGSGFTLMFALMCIIWNSLNRRIDKLSDKVEDVDRRLCRIEGSLATQGHCLFHQSNQPEKKAE